MLERVRESKIPRVGCLPKPVSLREFFGREGRQAKDLPPKPEVKKRGNPYQRGPGFFRSLGNRISDAFTPSY